jgi:hypothetical protein
LLCIKALNFTPWQYSNLGPSVLEVDELTACQGVKNTINRSKSFEGSVYTYIKELSNTSIASDCLFFVRMASLGRTKIAQLCHTGSRLAAFSTAGGRPSKNVELTSVRYPEVLRDRFYEAPFLPTFSQINLCSPILGPISQNQH